MGNASSKKLKMNQRASTVSLLSITSGSSDVDDGKKKERKKTSAYVYSEIILSLFESNGSLRNTKSSIASLALTSTGGIHSAKTKRNSASHTSNNASATIQKSRYLIQPKSATVYNSNFKVVIRGKTKKIKFVLYYLYYL
jgi:hypothetical protein